MADSASIRRQFPILGREVKGQPLTYLDNGATSQKPLDVIEVMDAYYREYNANVHRGVHTLSEVATDLYEGARSKVAGLLGASSPREVVFTRNITAGLNLVAQAWGAANLKPGARIINTTSVTAYRGSSHLLDYSATKGAIVAFTRSLSQQLAEKGIHVNAVAPGPIWTPLIPSTFPPDQVQKFGESVPLGRPGQPDEVAPAYVSLASDDASYMTGQVLHPNGGEIVNT